MPRALIAFLHAQLAAEIERGDTYPMLDALPLEAFGPYWFGVLGAVMVRGDVGCVEDVVLEVGEKGGVGGDVFGEFLY